MPADQRAESRRDPLFASYPDLAAEIECQRAGSSWALTGASALVVSGPDMLMEIGKPRHWRHDRDGAAHIGLGAIGGSLEAGETLLACLEREGREELGTALEIQSAEETAFCFDEQRVSRVTPAPRAAHPLPCLITVGENRYRRTAIAARTLAIATYWARVSGETRLGDLYGLVAIPIAAVSDLLAALPVPGQELLAWPGVRVALSGPLPPEAIVEPVWTIQTLRQMLLAGDLSALPSLAIEGMRRFYR